MLVNACFPAADGSGSVLPPVVKLPAAFTTGAVCGVVVKGGGVGVGNSVGLKVGLVG